MTASAAPKTISYEEAMGLSQGSAGVGDRTSGPRTISYEEAMTPVEEPKEKPGLVGAFTGAVSRGLQQTWGLAREGLPALVYSAMGNTEEADAYLRQLSARFAAAEKANPTIIKEIGDVDSPMNAAYLVAEALGENIPSLIPGLGAAGVGAGLGKAAIKKGATEAVESFAKRQAIGSGVGMGAGAVVGSAAQNIPETFADVAQETGEQRPGVAMMFGGLKAGLDAIPTVLALKRAFGPAITDKIAGNILKRMGVGATEQFVAEGVTEGAQEAIDIAASKFVDENREFFTPENVERIAFSGLKGGIGGAGIGAVTGAIGRRPDEAPAPPPEPPPAPMLALPSPTTPRPMTPDEITRARAAMGVDWEPSEPNVSKERFPLTEPVKPQATAENLREYEMPDEAAPADQAPDKYAVYPAVRDDEGNPVKLGPTVPVSDLPGSRDAEKAFRVAGKAPAYEAARHYVELTDKIGEDPGQLVERTLAIPAAQFQAMPIPARDRLIQVAMEARQAQQPGPDYRVQDTSGEGPTSAAPAPMREARAAPYRGAAENPEARVQPTSAEIDATGGQRINPRGPAPTGVGIGGSERPFPAGPDSSGLDFGNRRSWGAPRDPEAEFFERRANEMAARAKAAQQEEMQRRQEAYARWRQADEARKRAQNEEDLRRRYSEGQQYRDYEGAYREQTGQSRWGNADYSFKQGKYTPHPKPFDAEGNYPVDENGFVTSTGGGPIVFPTQKAAGRWILDHGNKRGRQVFEPANHPGVNGKFTVYQRGMTEPEQGPGPESGGAGPSASSASSARPALAPPVGPNQTQTPGRPSPGQAEGPSPEPTAAAPGAAPVSPDAPQPAPDSPRGPAATKPKTKAAPGTKKTQTEKAPTQPQTFPNESAGSYEDLRNQYSQDTGMSGEPRVAMDWLIRKGKETGNEHIVIVDKNGRVLSAGTANKPKEVAISAAGKNAMAVHGSNLVMHHNHPVETALSRTDTRVATLPGVRWVVAYTPTGLIDAAGPSEKLSAFMKTSSENTLGKIRTGISNAIDGVTSRIAELAGPLSRRAGVVIPDDEYRQSQIVQVLAGRTLERAGLINHIYTIPIDKKLLDAFERHEKEMANEIIRQFVQVLGFDGNSELFDRPTPQVSTNRALAAFSEGHAGLGSDTERAGAERGDRGGAGGFDATYPDRLEDVVPVPDINQQSILEEARNTTTGPSWFERGLPPIEAPMPKGKRSYTTYWTEWKDAGDGYASRAGINLPRLEIRTPEGDVVVRGWGTDGVEYNEIETGGWPTGERLRQVEDRMQALRDRAMRPKVQGKFAIGSRPSETRAGSSSGNENVGATIQTRPETSQQRAQATESLRQILRKLAGDKVDVKVVDRIVGDDANFDDAGGFYTADEGRRLIYIALASPEEMAAVLRHEVIHALRDLGIVQPKDWKTLVGQAAGWRRKYQTDQYYGGMGLTQEQLNEEAIAEAYADWMRGRYQPTSVIENVFRQIRAFFEALRNWAQGNGWNTAEDVFEAIEGGGMSNAEFDRTPMTRGNAFAMSRAGMKQQANGVLDMIKNIGATMDRLSNPLVTLPGDWRDYFEMRGMAKGEIQRIQEHLAGMRDLIGLPKAERDAALRYMTTKAAAPSMIQDPQKRAKFVEMKQEIAKLGQQLVDAGMLNEATYRTNRDSYLPRVYLKFVLDEAANRRGVGTGARIGAQGYLKQRQDIPEDVRKLVYGEIDDPGFLAVRSISVVATDLAKFNLLQKVSNNPDWVAEPKKQFVEWKKKKYTPQALKAQADQLRDMVDQMPEERRAGALKMALEMEQLAKTKLKAQPEFSQDYRQIPDTSRYGALRGMWVRKEIFNDMIGTFAIPNPDPSWAEQVLGMGGWATKATQWWKFGKVVANPPSIARNLMSGMIQSNVFGRIPFAYVPMRYTQAIQEILKNGKHWQAAQKFGIKGSGFAQNESAKIERAFLAYQKQQGGTATVRNLARFKDMIAHVVDIASDGYQFIESVGKVAVIIDAMERQGLSERDAVILAEEAQFDYSNVSPAVRYLRNSPIGMPFVTYMSKVAPQLIKTAATRPWAFGPYLAMAVGLPMLTQYMLDIDDDDLERLKKTLPKWAQETGSVYLLPFKDSAGRWHYWNAGYVLPWGQFQDAAHKAYAGKPLEAAKGMGMFGAPLVSLMTAVQTGIDPFTQRPIYNKADPPGRQWRDISLYLWSMSMPPWVGSTGFAKKLHDAALDVPIDKQGNPSVTMTQAVAGIFGISLYGLDPDVNRQKNLAQMKYEIDEIKRRRGSIAKDARLKPADKKAYLDEINAHIAEKAKAMAEYARETNVNPKLRVPAAR